MKQEELAHTLWTTRFLRGYKPATTQTTQRMNGEYCSYLKHPLSDFRTCSEAWKDHMESCVASNGNHFEGNKIQI